MAEQALHTFLFADISGYSLLAEREGDEAAADLAIHFQSTASRIARDHGAELVKGLGDAVMVHAEDAAESICLALDLLSELDRDPAFPQIHAGLHTGVALRRAGDWWGTTVNIAARVTAAAAAGQLLVTEATKVAAGDLASACVRSLGPLRCKNIALPVEVYAASRAPARSLLVA